MRTRIARILFVAISVCLAACSKEGANTDSPSIESLRSWLEENPYDTESWIQLSVAYLDLARRTDDLTAASQAETASLKSVELDESNITAHVQLGRVGIFQKKYSKALYPLGQAIERDFVNGEAWGLLGDAYFELGKYRSADSCYYEMYEVDSGFEALVRVATAAYHLRGLDEALKYMDEAIQFSESENVPDRSLAAAYLRFAEILFAHGFWDEAVANLNESLARAPLLIGALALNANILRLNGDLESAETICSTLVSVSDHPRYKSMLASVLFALDRSAAAAAMLDTATTQYEELYQRFPESVISDRVDFMLEWNVDPELAVALAYKASRSSRSIYDYERLAWAYHKNGKNDMAWSSIALALRKEAHHPRVFYRAAAIAKAAGKVDRYEKYRDKTRELNPRLEEMYGNL